MLERLGLSEDELCAVLNTDALTLLSGQAEHAPELRILTDLLDDAAVRTGPAALRTWVRARGPSGRAPVDALLARDFGAFEDALGELAERGFVVRGGGQAAGDDTGGSDDGNSGDSGDSGGFGGLPGQAPNM